jgi:hypothetical protein
LSAPVAPRCERRECCNNGCRDEGSQGVVGPEERVYRFVSIKHESARLPQTGYLATTVVSRERSFRGCFRCLKGRIPGESETQRKINATLHDIEIPTLLRPVGHVGRHYPIGPG